MNERFSYTYTAPTEAERKEIEHIRKKYQTESERGTLEQLKALDNKVHRFPTALALSLGVAGTLLFGLGFALILEWKQLILGACVSLVGIVPVALAYPVYRYHLAKGKKKYGEEILALSEKLLQ